MALVFHFHPLSSYCHKVLLALYENDTPFEKRLIDFAVPESTAAFRRLWPVAKMPVLEDDGRIVVESSIQIEYLDRDHPGAVQMVPRDPALALEVRLWDRFFDLYIHAPMQKVTADRLRPADERDPRGVGEALAQIATAYDLAEGQLMRHAFAAGETFSMADCAAAPALFYAAVIAPFADSHPALSAYFERLLARPSYQRVLAEARPYFHLYPFKESLPARFLR